MILLFAYGFLAIGVSFLCSLLEACLLSVPRGYVENLAERGGKAGTLLRDMKNNIDRPLAAILTLNTIAHTVGAAGVGGQAAALWGSAVVGIASAIMTLLILVVSEIIPKTLGAVHAKPLALPAAWTIRLIILLCIPIIVPMEWMNKLFGWQREGDAMSRGELLATLRLGQSSGAMDRQEYRIASNLISMANIHVEDVMTPRTVTFSLPEEMTVRQAIGEHAPLRYSRMPLHAAHDPDRMERYVTRYAIHQANTRGESDKPLRELAEPITVLPELAPVTQAMRQLMRDREHIALVVDEYGSTRGLVTLEDLLETLLGEEIVDETDLVVDMQAHARENRPHQVSPAPGEIGRASEEDAETR